MPDSINISDAIRNVRAGAHLSREHARQVFEQIMSGLVSEDEMADFLRAFTAKGETIEEITGAADVMNEKVTRVRCEADCIDTCGTGGDGISTFNASTTAAIIAAGAGAVVAKHGNRTNTRVSGSAEAISELGVRLDASVLVLEECLRECGIAFLYAPGLHPAMKYAAPVRRRIGGRTIFNLLGPLTNPAGAKRQLLGVPRPELTETLAQVLLARGAICAWVVHGHSGLCDVSITGPTRVTELRDGCIRSFTVSPEEVGFACEELSDLLVDCPAASARCIRAILDGQEGPCRRHAELNAAAALVVAGRARDLAEGLPMARDSIDSGRASEVLRRLVACSNT